MHCTSLGTNVGRRILHRWDVRASFLCGRCMLSSFRPLSYMTAMAAVGDPGLITHIFLDASLTCRLVPPQSK
jgi:hypothetical protein